MSTPTTLSSSRTVHGAASIYEDASRDALATGLNVIESWMSDASRAQKDWLSFFNHRLDKDTAVFAGLLQCASLGVFIDLQTEFWSGLANDYAELAQRSLCWLGDAAQHAVDEVRKET